MQDHPWEFKNYDVSEASKLQQLLQLNPVFTQLLAQRGTLLMMPLWVVGKWSTRMTEYLSMLNGTIALYSMKSEGCSRKI